MAFNVTSFKEKVGISGNRTQRERTFLIKGTDLDFVTLYEWLVDPNAQVDGNSIGVPIAPQYDERNLADVRLSEEAALSRDGDDFDIYEAVAIYDSNQPSAGIDNTQIKFPQAKFSFQVAPPVRHYRRSIETRHAYRRTGLAVQPISFHREINVDKDRKAEGVNDYNSPQEFTLEFTEVPAYFVQSRLATIGRNVGRVNQLVFRGFQAGELRFMGASGDISTTAPSNLRLLFGVLPSRNDIVIPGIDHTVYFEPDSTGLFTNQITTPSGITGIVAHGWDYIWEFSGFQEQDANQIGSRPKFLYVEKIFPSAEFNAIFQ